jgi:hypothetical protein
MGKRAVVIGADLQMSAQFEVEYAAAVDLSWVSTEVAALCTRLAETIADPAFPGALIPVPAPGGSLQVVAVAASTADWRRLNPILVAFAGPTLTSFVGIPEPIIGTDPICSLISNANPAATGILRLPAEPKAQLVGLRALARARDTLARAPTLQRSSPEPTSWLLARFQDHLNVGRREAASAILARLREELRLDALNLKFLEVQLLGAFEEWQSIVDLPGFAQLCVARRPPSISALLLEGLFQSQLHAAYDVEDKFEVQSRYAELVRPLATAMLTLPAPPTLRPGGWRLLALEALAEPTRLDLRRAAEGHRNEIGWIADLLEPTAEFEPVAIDAAPIDQARHALIGTESVDSLDALATALTSLERLNAEDLARLKAAEPFRSLLQAVAETAHEGAVPANWRDWLARIADPDFPDALTIARHGADEWSIGADAADPTAISDFVAALEAAQTDTLAANRASQALPFIVAWLRRDPEFPRPAFAPIFANLLTLFAMSAARGRPIYESSQILIHALLACGLDQKAYQSLIDDTDELAGSGFGADMIYWLLEIVEDLLRFASPDAEAREAFLHSALARIAPIQGRLTSLQRAAILRLADELGWQLQTFGLADTAPTPDDLAVRLANLKIAIYTLTESSSRQAKSAIEQAVPSTKVDCSADHGGTARLRALAENADLFVMTSSSAKHAATDFIREHRGDRPLLYAQGRGFSSILRAIEDHVMGRHQQA